MGEEWWDGDGKGMRGGRLEAAGPKESVQPSHVGKASVGDMASVPFERQKQVA